ncbi:MAG: 16S rRNA (cytosine(967)-C(5))-methyltransferase RsmB [Pseudomonadota bacterium]
MSTGAKVRANAAKAIAAVLGGAALDKPLAQAKLGLTEIDQGFVSALAYGTLRRMPRHHEVVLKLLRNPKKPLNPMMRALLALGLEQLVATRVPAHAAVDATVAASRLVNLGKGAGFLNAILRRYQREREAIDASLATNDSFVWCHPKWLIDKTRRDWPDDWQAILDANNAQPPMALRVNVAKTTRDNYLKMLQSADIEAAAIAGVDSALLLDEARPVEGLPGFADGLVSVQDAGAQLAAAHMAIDDGALRVLDACAAPGGKAMHMLERNKALSLYALDLAEERLERVEDNADRLGVSPHLITGSAVAPEDWWDGESFDRILVDAPCSGSGVMRRHPDIKMLRRPKDARSFPEFQREILRKLWPTLKPGGRMIYATCSVFPEENEDLLSAWLEGCPTAQIVPLECALENSKLLKNGVQILPNATGSDGFYYAAVEKRRE